MIIGTVRPEEARAFSQDAGEHTVPAFPCALTYEVYWSDGAATDEDDDGPECCEHERPGWYWSAGWGAGGPFATSTRARSDAEAELDERGQDDAERRAELR